MSDIFNNELFEAFASASDNVYIYVCDMKTDRLRGRGFKMALDDFGTAYASLEMLKCLHVDYIKIEHSFVRELSEPGHEIDYVIIDNLLEMCRRLGYDSIVEGVENSRVAQIVGEMNATLLQGYYYSRPVCREDFEKLMEARVHPGTE